MSRDFNDAANEWMTVGTPVITGAPYSIGCFFNTDGEADSWMALVSLADISTGVNYITLAVHKNSSNNEPFLWVRSEDASVGVHSWVNITQGQWYHACAVSANTSSHKIYVNGNEEGSDTTGVMPSGLDNTTIAALNHNNRSYYFDGRIAEVGIWNAALTDAEVKILAAGFSPLFVRPQNLVGYWPLVRKTSDNKSIDKVGGFTLNEYNTPGQSAHPPIIYPGHTLSGRKPGTGISVPALMQHYKRMRIA